VELWVASSEFGLIGGANACALFGKALYFQQQFLRILEARKHWISEHFHSPTDSCSQSC
jgi:hypothetical protein